MNSVLIGLGRNVLPKISNICFFARDQINNKLMPLINEVVMDSIENVDAIQFLGIRKLTPIESYHSLLGSGDNIKMDITRSSFYPTVLMFRTKAGDPINVESEFPYVDRFGVLTNSDVRYMIKPIFTDNVISAHANGIFIKLYISKPNITSAPYICRVNGKSETLSVIHGDMNKYIVGAAGSDLAKKVTPLAFYMLTTNGLMETIRVATSTPLRLVLKKDYTYDSKSTYYTTDDLDIGFVLDNDVRLDVIDNIMTSVLYILSAVKPKQFEIMNYINTGDLENELVFWTVYFGRFFYKGSLSFDKSTREIITHLDKVGNYLDTVSRTDLRSIDIDVHDWTGLTYVIHERYNMIVLNHKTISSNILGKKKLNVLYYIGYPVILGVNTSLGEIDKRDKARKNDLSTKEMETILTTLITKKITYTIVKSTKKNLAVQLDNGCTDSLLNHLLSSDDQNRGNGIYVPSNVNPFPAVMRTITAEHFAVGSMHGIGKKCPSPLTGLNPFTNVNSANQLVLDPKLQLICSEANDRAREVTEYVNHQVDDGTIDNMDDV